MWGMKTWRFFYGMGTPRFHAARNGGVCQKARNKQEALGWDDRACRTFCHAKVDGTASRHGALRGRLRRHLLHGVPTVAQIPVSSLELPVTLCRRSRRHTTHARRYFRAHVAETETPGQNTSTTYFFVRVVKS